MRATANPTPKARRAAWVIHATCATIAVLNLPAGTLPPGWLLAFLGPGALLGLLPGLAHRPWWRLLVALTLQLSACGLALWLAGPVTRPAALACTILPPLGFATLRGTTADQALTLFLSFCVLLVGVILDGLHAPLLTAYAAAGCLALRSASHVATATAGVRARVDARMPLRAGATSAIGTLVLGALFCAMAIDRTLGWLPSPSRIGSRAPAHGSDDRDVRRPGLDDSFVLGGGNLLAELNGEQLVIAHSLDGSAVPADLYLRSGFFAAPGMDRWEPGALDLGPVSRSDELLLREPGDTTTVRTLAIERRAGGQNFVFVPPGTVTVQGLGALAVDAAREWIRPTATTSRGIYRVAYERPPQPEAGAALARSARRHGLLTVPRALDRARCERLLDDWGVGTEPLAAMEAIAAGLARHCRYDRLVDPTGPHAFAIENFLFAPGERRGYCMHFASAAALLLRLRGIPCRIGVGLFGGTTEPGSTGGRVFGSQHAHAWVEVPFEDHGYVVFDPTPPSERAQASPARVDQPLDDTQVTTSGVEVWLQRGRDLLAQPWLLTSLLVLAIVLALRPVRRAQRGPTTAVRGELRHARRLLGQVLKGLATAGHPRGRGQTLELLARSLASQGRLPTAIGAAFTAYQEVRFGGRTFDAAHEHALRAGIAAAATLAPLATDALTTPGPSR